MSAFRDILEPTGEEIRRWAYSSGGDYPDEMEQDWDLIVADCTRLELIAELASDPACETRAFFVSCLYLLSGECVRYSDQIDHSSMQKIRQFIASHRASFDNLLTKWADRSLDLFEHPETFDYGKWCWHGHAYGIDDEEGESLAFLGRIRKLFNL